MDSTQKISVVVSVLNGARHLERCIASVADQSIKNKELIIIDGASTDGSVEIIKRNEASIAYWVSQKDSGISAAWNKALYQVTGKWICFLGADDYFYDKDALKRIYSSLMTAYPQYSVVYGKVVLIDQKGSMLGTFGESWEKVKSSFLSGKDLYIHQAMFHHCSLFERYGAFDDSLQIASDYEFLLRELVCNDPLFVQQPVAVMQHGGLSSNPIYKYKCINEIIKVRKKHGLTGDKAALFLARLRAEIHALLYIVAGRKVSALTADFYRLLVGKEALWSVNSAQSKQLRGEEHHRDQ